MINVLIAEDEPPILRSLQQTIESQHPDFQVIATAYDGDEAIQAIQRKKPDVVFTDIRMPVKDGTEVLEYLRVYAPDIIPVVISGYQEFAYARKALQCHAVDYLLKPVSLQDARKLLDKIAELFQERVTRTEERYLSQLINNRQLDSSVPGSLSDYLSFQVMAFCLGSFPIDATIISRAPDFHHAWEQLKENFQDCVERYWEIRGKTTFEKILIIGNTFDAKGRLLDSLTVCQQAFSETHPSLPITSIINSAGMKLEDIPLAAGEFRRLLRKNVKIGCSQILFYPDCLEDPADSSVYKKTISAVREKTLLHTLEHRNTALFYEELHKLFEEWKTSAYPQVIVEKNLKYLATACQRVVALHGKHNGEYVEMEVNEAVSASLDYEMLFERVWVIFESFFMQTSNRGREDEQHVGMMETIDAYLQRNFTEPIDTQILAEKIGRAPSYISQLFRKYKGMTPTQYLIQLRIEKAKECIRTHPELRIKDIALMVGYEDPYYFSRIFKQKTGMGPSEYKASPCLEKMEI